MAKQGISTVKQGPFTANKQRLFTESFTDKQGPSILQKVFMSK